MAVAGAGAPLWRCRGACDERAAYDPRLDIDFTPLRDADPATEGFSQAA